MTAAAHGRASARTAPWTGYEESRGLFPRIVDGEGVELVLEDGRRVLDGTNTGAPLGHRHPHMVEAMRRAISAPIVHEAWSSAERDEAIAELVAAAFAGEEEWFGGLRFCLSGSDANDLALSLAQAVTGRTDLATRERAYHGGVGLSRDVTVQPHWHGGLSWRRGGVAGVPRTVPVTVLPAPRGERIGPTSPDPDADRAALTEAAARLHRVAAVIVDYTQGATYHAATYQDLLAETAARAGALWIADEVVTGLGRTGSWFSFTSGESRPDVITLGKGLAGGAAPGGAVLVSRPLAERLADGNWQTSGTFRGHPLTVAGLRAYLEVLVRDRLVEHVAELDRTMHALLKELHAAHPSVRRIDGRGLHWTVELHGADWREWRADTQATPLATRVSARAVEAGAFIQTSGEASALVLAPPFVSEPGHLERLVAALDHGLALADAEVAP